MRALITGISGQDGKHLSKFLLAKGYEVFGFSRSLDKDFNRQSTLKSSDMHIFETDLNDYGAVLSAIGKIKPDEIYNLASMSYVIDSISTPLKSAEVNAIGPLKLLEAIVELDLVERVKIFQASSSEMFGNVIDSPQNEHTPYFPITPYGIAKVFGHYTFKNYRDNLGLFAACGILFNHEGEHRDPKFVTRKISQSVARIALGKQQVIKLGNLDSRRDWGYAGDYVEAMWLILQSGNPDDYVISTGETHTVREFLEKAFKVVGIENGIHKHVQIDANYVRKFDSNTLVGNSKKAREILGWTPKVSFDDLVNLMVKNDLELEK